MKSTKKILAGIASAVMICTIPMQAMATVTLEGQNTSTDIDVYALYNAGDKADVYNVSITWGSMSFSYDANEQWDKETHEWKPSNATWSVNEESNEITLVNDSSVEVTAGFSFTNAGDYTTVSGIFNSADDGFIASNNSLTMGVAQAKIVAKSHIVTFIPSGSIPASVNSNTEIGEITVTLS